jgi:hypothetical protein
MLSRPDGNPRGAAEKYLPTVRFVSTVFVGKMNK